MINDNLTLKNVLGSLHVILHCLVRVRSFNGNNGDATKPALPHYGS